MNLPTVLLLLLPAAALSRSDPTSSQLERMFYGMPFHREFGRMSSNPNRAKRALGIMGVCEQAAECMVRMQADYTEHRAPEMRRLMKAAGPRPYGLIIDEMCSAAANVSASCFAHCTPGEDSVFSVFNSANHMICTERRDDVKEAVECAKDFDLFSRPFRRPFIEECGDMKDVLDRHTERMHDGYRNGTELKYQADEVFGEHGFIANWCRQGSCYLDELESVSEEKCGERRHGKLVRDVLDVLVPKAVAMLDRLYIGCLLPKRCKRAP